MRHVRTSHPRTITDPATGRTYVVPQGGAEGDGEQSGDGEGDESTTGETPDGDEDESSSDTDEDTDEDDEDGAGSKAAVLRDLKRERTRRQELEQEIAELRREHETEDERRQREAAEREAEIRQEAQAPAMRALRTSAVETAAREAGFVDPADAAAFVDLDTIDVDLETATPDREAAKQLVTELAEAKPHLVRAEDRPGSPAGGSDTQSPGGTTSTDPNVTHRDLARRKLGSRV